MHARIAVNECRGGISSCNVRNGTQRLPSRTISSHTAYIYSRYSPLVSFETLSNSVFVSKRGARSEAANNGDSIPYGRKLGNKWFRALPEI